MTAPNTLHVPAAPADPQIGHEQLRTDRTAPAHPLAQARIRSLGGRPIGPLRVARAAPAPSRAELLTP